MKLYTLTIGLLIALLPTAAGRAQTPTQTDPRDTLALLAEQERLRTMDPALGRVPYERLDEARRQLAGKQPLDGAQGGPAQVGIPGLNWQERGPSNAGGRSRAVLFDPNDPTKKKVWVGNPGGGLWYTNDITNAATPWTQVFSGGLVATAIASDPSNSQVMYLGTGDGYGSAQGQGLLKSTDGGVFWSSLSSTFPGGAYPSITQGFAYVQKIVVNSSGHVFVGTRFGVVRSIDGGTTWSLVLAPNQNIGGTPPSNSSIYNDFVTDLEIGSDGILYVAFNPSRVFRSNSNTGVGWTEITPAGPTYRRTELALAPSTSGASQVVYAVTESYNSTNFQQDIRWFKKSTNGGTTWTDVAIPARSTTTHFTEGGGYKALQLLVHPTDPNLVWAGGFNWYRSTNGGTSWSGLLNSRYRYQQALALQPGGTGAVLTDDFDIIWSANWSDMNVASPAQLVRSDGFRAAAVKSVSMKNLAGGVSLFYGVDSKGHEQMTSAGLSAGVSTFGGIDQPGATFVDENEPDLQILQVYNNLYLRLTAGQSQLLTNINGWYTPVASDYDSQSNTLYVADFTNGQTLVKKVTGVGSTPVSTSLVPTGFNQGTIPTLRLSRDRASLLLGTSNGKLYRMTNTATPTVTAIDGNAFPQYTSVSSIDIGANDNELLVTLSNFGVQSVWYTSDGGATWVSKDAVGYGLPDVPVRTVLFNPQNRQQVLLGTDAGIFTTISITASNPGWEYNSSQLGTTRVNQLRYRPADGRVAAATDGRGVFTTDALSVPFTPSGMAITFMMNFTTCAGSMNAVAYSGSGPVFSSTRAVEIWLSDAAGNFVTGTRLTTFTAVTNGPGTVGGTASFTIPSGLITGNYGLKLLVPSADIESSAGTIYIVGALTVRITDRATAPWYTPTSSYVCTGDPVRLNAATINTASGSAVMADTYQWRLNGTAIAGATSQTYLAGLVGNYQVVVQQTGCAATSSGYDVQQFSNGGNLNIVSRFGDLPQCDDSPPTLIAYYTGEQAAMQWIRNGADIGGATSSSYVATQSGNYSYRITRSGCTTYPQPLAITLGRSLLADLAFTGDSVLCNGTSKGSVFMASSKLSSSQTGAGSYQISWYRDNVLTNQYQNVPYFFTSQSGRYNYELRQGTCVTRSNAVVVSEGTIIPPRVSLDYGYISKSVCPSDTRPMYVIGNYGPYQWQRDGVDIANATNSNYTAQVTGVYTVRGQKGSCVATSLPLSLTFSNALRPQIRLYDGLTQACNELYMYGYPEINANNLQYQWFKDEVSIAGGVNGQYTVTQAGLYSISVTSGACTGLSKPLYMRPNTIRKPAIVRSTPVGSVCSANIVFLSMVSYRGSALWKRNGVPVSTENPYSFYATQSGLYTVQETTSCGVAESDPVEVKIGEPTSASLSGGAFVSSGQVAQLPVLLSGPAPWSFTLSGGQSVQNTYLNPHMVSVTAAATSTFALTGLQNACGTGTTLGQATLTVGSGQADLSVLAQVSSRVARLNDVITYSLQISNAGPQDAGGVQVVNRLPAGVEFVEAITPGITEANGVVTSTIGTVQANVPVMASYRVRITQPGTYFSAAEVTATNTPDPDSQPNSGTGDGQDDASLVDLRTTDAGGAISSANPGQVPLPRVISGQPPVPAGKVELSLDVRSSVLTPKIGETVNFSMVVANRGVLTATYVVVQVQLPTGWSVANSAGFVVTGQTVQAYLYQLPAGAPQVLVLPLQANSAGNGAIRVQILDVAEAVANATPGNGFQNGERDEANVYIQVR